MSMRELEQREKIILGGGLFISVLFIYIMFFTGGESSRGIDIKRVKKDYATYQQDMEKYQSLKDTVETVDKNLLKTPKDYDLYDELNKIIADLDLGDNFKNMAPKEGGNEFYSESYVILDLKNISTNDMVSLLKKIDRLKTFTRVSNISIKRRYKEEGSLDINIRVSAYSKQEGDIP
jgi:hypothetical protein